MSHLNEERIWIYFFCKWYAILFELIFPVSTFDICFLMIERMLVLSCGRCVSNKFFEVFIFNKINATTGRSHKTHVAHACHVNRKSCLCCNNNMYVECIVHYSNENNYHRKSLFLKCNLLISSVALCSMSTVYTLP